MGSGSLAQLLRISSPGVKEYFFETLKNSKLLVNLPIVNKLLKYLFSKTLTIKVKNKSKNYKINCWIPQVTVLYFVIQ